jgi:hypothetical protein
LFCVLFEIKDLGRRWGDRTQALALWGHPAASSVALEVLHWAMSIAPCCCIAMAIKTAKDLPAFFFIIAFVVAHNHR